MTRYYTTILALGKLSFGITDMSEGKAKRCTVCFFILLLIDVLDLVCDWLFFLDVYLIEKGLVFGPHDPKIVWVVLALTIVGTIDFPLQVYVTSQETLNGKPKHKEERRLNLFNLVILLLEDIPQAVIVLLISLCREDPSSIWNITKASFILLTGLIKFIPNISACRKKFSFIKTVVLIGAFLDLSMALVVFFVTQIELTRAGGLQFNRPTTLVDDRFNDNLYLSQVSLFIHDPNFLTEDSTLTISSKNQELRWLRIDYLRRIQKSGYSAVRLEYEKSKSYNDQVKLRVWEKESAASPTQDWVPNGCYTISLTSGRVHVINPTYLSCSLSAKESSSLYLTFKYIEPEEIFKKHIMGNIEFNAKYQAPGGEPKIMNKKLASSLFSNNVTIEDLKYSKERFNGIQVKTPILLHYFRHQPVAMAATGIHENNNVIITGNGSKIEGHLYKNNKDTLKDVKDVWQTGWLRCSTTGNLGPEFNPHINFTT